ncbi:hypothetical protein C8J56DRAFT_961186 [Mycena floridula]|nr:hypothetical protein C8J56DRAFT_961186 [Mycena floridula]
MTILQCTLSLVLLLFFSEASALITISIPKIIVSGQPFQVTWTRSATDPTSFFVELLQDGTPVTSIPTGAKGTSGVVQIPQLILNPGQALDSTELSIEADIVQNHSASGGGNILGESNVFEIVGPVVSSSTPLPPSSAVTGFTPSQTTPKATQTRTVTEDSNSPHSSSSTVLTGPISTTVDSISSTSASVTALPVTSGSGTSHLLTNPGSKTTISVISVSSPSPSRFVSNQHPAASKLPIIIGCVVAVLVVCISLTFLLCYLRRRSRQNQNQEQDPVSPFADYTVSTPWVPGKVREPFTTSNAGEYRLNQ